MHHYYRLYKTKYCGYSNHFEAGWHKMKWSNINTAFSDFDYKIRFYKSDGCGCEIEVRDWVEE